VFLVAIAGIFLLCASFARAADNWPQLFGPTGDGQSGATGLPVTWSETENVKWKTPIHDRGHSSPVIWDRQIWLTTAAKDGKQMFAVCVDRDSGKIVFDLKLYDIEKPEFCFPLNSYASPTPVVEAGRVYVHFGTYGTTCLDTQTGKPLWERRDLHCVHFRGPGSSPILCGDLLILHFDGFDVQYLVALDKKTGKTVWKTDRSTEFGDMDGDLRKAYATPTVITTGGKQQLISPGAKAAMAYDPNSGAELWKIRYDGFSNVARPLFSQGLVLINTGFGSPELWAVRPDGRGDVTGSHVVWKQRKGVPAKPTPVIVGDAIYMVNDSGIASCIEVASGKPLWQSRVGGEFSASPLVADGRIYVPDQDGKTIVLAPGREFQQLAANKLAEGCMASPAAVGKAIYLRTKTHLYRIEK
jgi:outer membrane protein assembly factor BamB